MKLRITCAVTLGLTALSVVARAGEESIKLVDAPGRDLVAVHCVLCHSADYIPMNAPVMDRSRWEAGVRKMIDKLGAPVSEADAAAIVDYLAGNYSDRK